jgi:hypothetical protein
MDEPVDSKVKPGSLSYVLLLLVLSGRRMDSRRRDRDPVPGRAAPVVRVALLGDGIVPVPQREARENATCVRCATVTRPRQCAAASTRRYSKVGERALWHGLLVLDPGQFKEAPTPSRSSVASITARFLCPNQSGDSKYEVCSWDLLTKSHATLPYCRPPTRD